MDYLKDIRIDETALDVEWLEQAELAIKWGKYYSQCKEEFTRAEENVKVIYSELLLAINKNPEKYLGKGIKPTDAKVDAAIRIHPKHKAAKEEWIDAMKKLNDAEIIKSEISFTRKAALENLVQLHGQNYFAGPSVPRNLKSERESRKQQTEEHNKRIRKITKRS